MSQELTINSPHKDFESSKHIDTKGFEYWTARELMKVLGYSTWRRFEDTINRAQQACMNSRQFPQDHFADIGKMTKVGRREEVAKQNKKLFSTAKLAGVSNFGKFNDAGYKGLYNTSLKEIEEKKRIPKGQLLDHAGSEELGANLFRITQTEAKLKREQIKGDDRAQQTNFDIGKKVRQTIKDIGGTMPENLESGKHIKILEKKDKKIPK